MIILPVNICKLSAYFVQVSEGDNVVIDPADVFAGSRNLSCYHVFLIIIIRYHLNDSFICSRANKSSIRPAAQSETDCFYNYGFAGSCFAGNDIKSIVEVHIDIFDNSEISDADMSDHLIPLR